MSKIIYTIMIYTLAFYWNSTLENVEVKNIILILYENIRRVVDKDIYCYQNAVSINAG